MRTRRSWHAADALLAEVRAQHEAYAINRALDAIWKVVADANRYFAGQEPWALKKTDPARMGTVLYVTAEVLRMVGILIQPYMPQSAAKLLDLLGVPATARLYATCRSGWFRAWRCRRRSRFSRAMWRRGKPRRRVELSGRRQPLPSRLSTG